MLVLALLEFKLRKDPNMEMSSSFPRSVCKLEPTSHVGAARFSRRIRSSARCFSISGGKERGVGGEMDEGGEGGVAILSPGVTTNGFDGELGADGVEGVEEGVEETEGTEECVEDGAEGTEDTEGAEGVAGCDFL